MQVAGLLNLMGNLSLGNDNITQVERSIFLQYLNLAHLELYQVTANFNQDLLTDERLVSEHPYGSVTLSEKPYLVNSVYDASNQQNLSQMSLAAKLAQDPLFMHEGRPRHYFVKRARINFVPRPTTSAVYKVWYVPQPITLTEQTTEQDIPYPLAYHPVLVDGALYYLFQEEGGFKNLQKAQAAQARWEVGKTRLLAYLYNSSGQLFSTFSSV